MLMTAGKFNDLRHFSFRHLVGEHPANTHAMAVDMQHHLNGFLAILVEEALENVNDELHGRVVVVQDENLIEAGLLGLWACFCDNAGSVLATGSAVQIVIVLVVSAAHARQFYRTEFNGKKKKTRPAPVVVFL